MSNQTRKMAAALKFNPEEDTAPQMVAKGLGLIAENIIKTAEASSVPVYVDEKLTQQLNTLELGHQIPYELYEVVAEVLVFISKMDKGAST